MPMTAAQISRALRQVRAKQEADEARIRTRVTSRDLDRILAQAAHDYLARVLAYLDAGRPVDKDDVASRSALRAARRVLGWSRFECLSDRQLERLGQPAGVRSSARLIGGFVFRSGGRDYLRQQESYSDQMDGIQAAPPANS